MKFHCKSNQLFFYYKSTALIKRGRALLKLYGESHGLERHGCFRTELFFYISSHTLADLNFYIVHFSYKVSKMPVYDLKTQKKSYSLATTYGNNQFDTLHLANWIGVNFLDLVNSIQVKVIVYVVWHPKLQL